MCDKYTYTHITITVYIRMPIIYRYIDSQFPSWGSDTSPGRQFQLQLFSHAKCLKRLPAWNEGCQWMSTDVGWFLTSKHGGEGVPAYHAFKDNKLKQNNT